MMRRLQVWIWSCRYVNEPCYRGSDLSLPARQEALNDAFQRGRVKEGEPYLLEVGGGWPEFLRPILARCNKTLEELNLLANKLTQLSKQQEGLCEGVIKLLPEKNMKQVINALYNLGQFEFLPGIVCDEDIGEMTIDNDLEPILKDLPGELYPLLDTEKVGAYVREKENGVFTSKGYCYCVSDQWQEVYDGKQLSEPMDRQQSMFSLHLIAQKEEPMNPHQKIWLDVPFEAETKAHVLKTLGIHSFGQCRIIDMRSAVPLYEQITVQNQDIDQMNHLAKKLSALTEKELLKYKAVAEFESCSSLEQAIQLTDMLDSYEFDPVQVTYGTYGRECLKQMGADLEAEAFRRFDFEGYGKELYAQAGRKLTAYGAVLKGPCLEKAQSQNDSIIAQGMG